MEKMIIRYEGVSPCTALDRVDSVILKGRVSNGGEYYAYLTTFSDGTVVIADRTPKGTDTFRVTKILN